MLDVAECIVVGALERKESRGAQFRLDFPKRNDDEWLKHINLSLNGGDVPADLVLARDHDPVGAAGAHVLDGRLHAQTPPLLARDGRRRPTGRTSRSTSTGTAPSSTASSRPRTATDASIGIRCSCRAAICGSCGVRINGKPDLACHMHLDKAAENARRRRHHGRADGQHARDQGPDRRHGRGPLEEDPARHAVAAARRARSPSASTSCRPSR